MSGLWRRARLPVTVALAFVASPRGTREPVVEKLAKMPEPVVLSEVQPTSENPTDVTLACSVERNEKAVRLHYFLSNESSGTILVFDRIRFNAMRTLTLPVDVVCDAGAGSVNLVLGLSPAPIFSPHLATTYPQGVGQDTSVVLASANVAKTIELALPLVEWDEWNANTSWSKVATKRQAVVVHTARLVVDFVRRDRKDYDQDFPARTAESVWCAVPLSPPVTLLRHPAFGELGDPNRLKAFNLGPDKVSGGEAGLAGFRELNKATNEHRAFVSTVRRRGTSPVGMPRWGW